MLTETLFRLEMMFRMQQKAESSKYFLSNPVADFSELGIADVSLAAKEKTALKVGILRVITKLEAEADKLIALGGVADAKILAGSKPSEAVNLLQTVKDNLSKMIAGLPLVETKGEYGQVTTPEQEEGLLNTLATVGQASKQYVGWFRPQIEAL